MFDSKLAIILCRSFALFNFLPQCPNCVLGNANLLYTNMLSYYIYTNILTTCKCFLCTQYLNIVKHTRYSRFPLYFLTPQLQPVCTVFFHTKFTASLHCSHLHHIYSWCMLYTLTTQLQPVYNVHSQTTITAGLHCTMSHHI